MIECGWWDPEEFVGVPLDHMCATPKCGSTVGGKDNKHAGGRGLCVTCYQAWRRHGIPGLLRRAARVAKGVEYVRAPMDMEGLRDAIRRLALEYAEVDGEEEWTRLDRRLLNMALRLGQLDRRIKQREQHIRHREKFIRERGIEEWKNKDRLRKTKHRVKLRLVDLTLTEGTGT